MAPAAVAVLAALLAALLTTPTGPGGAQEAGGELDPPGVGSAFEIPDRSDLPEVDVVALQGELAGQALPAAGPDGVDEAVVEAAAEGNTRVMIELDVAATPEGHLSGGATVAQRSEIAGAAEAAAAAVEAAGGSVHRTYQTVPWIAAEVDAEALDALAGESSVRGIEVDRVLQAATTDEPASTGDDRDGSRVIQTQTLLGNAGAWDLGYDGSGRRVAVIDSGVESSHPFFGGRVEYEACFSSTGCPGGGTARSGPGTGQPCTWTSGTCGHGTNVAGIAAGGGEIWSASGPARAAGIVAVSAVYDTNGAAPGGGTAFLSADLLAALDWLHLHRNALALGAVNMSLGGGGPHDGPCADPINSAIANLWAAGIPTVVASGNNGWTNGVAAPACSPGAVGVGNTRKHDDSVAPSSNSGGGPGVLDLLAPGSGTPCGSGEDGIVTAEPGGGWVCTAGTSAAAPHVAGLATVLKQKHPEATVPHLVASMQVAGVPVTDSRNGVTRPRIAVDDAVRVLFRDVPVDSPFWFEVAWLAYYEITTGFDGGRYFQPTAEVSRQAMAAFLYRLAGEPAFTPPSTATFDDVPTDHPFFHEIEWLDTTGYPDGGFHPGERVTRQAMSAFMFRGFGNPAFSPPAVPSFADVPTNHPFFREVEWMAAQEITGGFPDGGFHPSAAVSRQAMAAFMFRLADA